MVALSRVNNRMLEIVTILTLFAKSLLSGLGLNHITNPVDRLYEQRIFGIVFDLLP